MQLVTHEALLDEPAHVFTYRFCGAGVEMEVFVKIAVDDARSAHRFAANILAEMAAEMRRAEIG